MKTNFISDKEIDTVLGRIGEFKSEPEWKSSMDGSKNQKKPDSLAQTGTSNSLHTFSYLLDNATKNSLGETRQGALAFEVQKAGIIRRIYALAADLCVIAILIMGFIYGSTVAFGADSFVFAKLPLIERLYSYGVTEILFWMVALYGVLLFLYMFYFEATLGQTPGKMLLNIRIVDESNEKPPVSTMALRLFLFFMPPLGLFGIHNRLTGTRIILT